jgi:hypothetical protein
LWCENRNHGAGINKRLAYFNTVSGLPVQIPPGYDMVTVDQVDESSQSFETMGRWNQGDFTYYKVPYDFVFQENSSEVLRAKQDFKTGTSQKYNQWLVAQVFNDIINHKSFTISNNQPDITGSFKSAHNATIHTEFITISQMDIGEVQFKDPWLRIEGDPKYYDPPYGYRNLGMDDAELEAYNDLPLELFTSNDFKGVFLDQLIEPGKPYYTVAASDQQIGGVTYFLSDWSASPSNSAEFEDAGAGTTAVIFRQPNAVVTARMKGHLASSTANATAGNNAYKIAADIVNDVLHLVYIDRVRVYYTNSTNGGQTWSQDFQIDGSTQYECLNPGVGVDKNGIVHVTWERKYSDGERDDYTVHHRQRDDQGSWLAVETIGDFPYGGYQSPTTPAVYTEYDGRTYVVWRYTYYFGEIYGGLVLRSLGYVAPSWSGHYEVPGSDTDSYTPAISYGGVGGSPYSTQIVWEDRSEEAIMHITGDYDQGEWVWGSAVNISSDPNLSDHQLPSLHQKIGIYPNNLYAVWQAMEADTPEEKIPSSPNNEGETCTQISMEQRVVCFKEKQESWGTLNIFIIDNTCDRNPVVTDWEGSAGRDVAVVYEKGAGEAHYLLRQSGQWDDEPTVLTGDGNHPALTAINNVPHAAWTANMPGRPTGFNTAMP